MTQKLAGEKFRAEGWWRDTTFLDDLHDAALSHPGQPAVVCWHTDGRPTDSVTYAQLAHSVERLASALVGLEVGRGDVVTLQLPNSWQLVALCLACSQVGAVPNPVLPIMRRREVGFMMGLTESPVYIAAAEFRGFSYADLGAELAQALPTIRHRVLLDGADVPGALDFDRDLLGGDWATPTDLGARAAGPDDPALIMFTSGTTGEPKGVLHTGNTLYSINRSQADVLNLSAEEVTAMGSPTTHFAGYTWNFLMPLMLGGTAVQVDSWDPELMLRIIEQERVTFFMGAPTFLADLIEAQVRGPRDLSALDTFATGSAPIPPVVVEQAREVLGCRLYALWGMTENGGATITRPEEPLLRAAESDGTPVPGMDVRIVDEENNPVTGDVTGRLQVRGSGQCLGYYRRPELYAESLTPDGWFDTGDLAHDDGHGGIRIAGRIKDVIVRGAEKIPAVEVEASLLRHASVRDVAVVGYPDERLGQRAAAIIVPEGAPPTLDDLCAHLADLGMAKQYWPERVEIVEALPKTPSGKVQKFVLREGLA